MSAKRRPTYLLMIIILLLTQAGYSQAVLVNSNGSVYSINEAGTVCASIDIGPFCDAAGFGGTVFSTALHNDTLYFVSFDHTLYRMKLGSPGSCTPLTSFPQSIPGFSSLNSLAADRQGLLYTADAQTRELRCYNPYTNSNTLLGILNVRPAGDMIFYKNKLLVTGANSGVYEVNRTNPSASTLYIPSPGRVFFGLIAVPFDCTKNRYYGLEWWMGDTRLHELDMENRVVIGTDCMLPVLVFDGASAVDNGTTLGIIIDTVIAKQSCTGDQLVDLQVKAYTAAAGGLSFTLNGGISNSTGVFTGLPAGSYTLRVNNQLNCFTDTLLEVKAFPASPVTVVASKVDPVCSNRNGGQIAVTATGAGQPYSLRLNNISYVNGSTITGLGAGNYEVLVLNADQCVVDTVRLRLDISLTNECDGLFVPGGFTPDGNGLNDLFIPYAGNNIQGYQFRVYNRWGELVFMTTEKNRGWDGRIKGQQQPSGIYAWLITYHTITNPEKKIEKGTVMLIK